jgi:hypothetical protein
VSSCANPPTRLSSVGANQHGSAASFAYFEHTVC